MTIPTSFFLHPIFLRTRLGRFSSQLLLNHFSLFSWCASSISLEYLRDVVLVFLGSMLNMSRPAIGVLLCGTLGQIVSASTFFILEAGTVANSSTATLSTACVSSIESSVQCNSYLQNVANADIYGTYDSTTQDGLCDPNCGSSLASYHSSVVASCSNDPMPWDGLPAQYYGDRVWSAYNTTCLKDSSTGQYCSSGSTWLYTVQMG